MKVSKYNFLYKMDSGEDWLAYNSRTGSLCTLNSSYYNALKALEEDNEAMKDEEYRKGLSSCGYIVEDDIDELELIRFDLCKQRFNNSFLSFTLAPTMNCNFRCVYCFEKDRIHSSKMSEEVCEKLISFISKRANDTSRLHITWFGGEPLLEMDILFQLSQKIIKICQENNIEYISSVITNGYLLSPSIAEKLIECGVSDIQITLDGPEDIHNSRRPLAGGQGSFTKILNNVIQCAHIIKTVIRINTDIKNMERTGEIIDIFKKAGVFDKLIFNLGLVEASNNSYEDNILTVEEYSKFNLKFIKDNGIDLLRIYPSPKGNFCTADKNNAFVIDADGYIYKCWTDIGIVEKNIGSLLDEDKVGNTRLCMDYLLYDPTSDDNCKNCKYIPICMGGCPHRRIEHIESCSDKKYVLEEYLRECANLFISRQNETKKE